MQIMRTHSMCYVMVLSRAPPCLCMQRTNSITLNASKARAFEHSKLYAQNATSVSINCASKYYRYSDYSGGNPYFSHDSACFQGDWYLPDHGTQTILNCYAYGCYSFEA
eukprot:30883_1